MSGHSHDHHEGGESHGHAHDHARTFQPDIEDAPFTHYQVMAQALGDLLVEKGVFTADELRRQIEIQDSRTPAEGAKLVARAWTDAGFAQLLARDVNAAAATLAIPSGDIPIRALFDAPGLHNVVVCTLCSCYPRMLLGIPPDWYKSRNYRSRMVREPRAVLAEFGLKIPGEVQIRVHDSTADMRYMVLPMRPAGTDGWSEERLASIVNRDSMIGVALPKA